MSQTVVKELIAKFSSDTKGLESGSEKAAAVISSFATKSAKALGAVGLAFAALGVKQSLVGDELGKISDKFGVSTEALSRLDHAADLAGVSTQELANSFKFMQGSLSDAVNGSEPARAAYARLGLDFNKLIAMKPEDSFSAIGDAISKIENPALKSATAVDIFGRSGTNLIPLFKDGAEGLRLAEDEAARFGLEISRIDSSQLEAANDAVSKIGSAANGAARQFAVGLSPAISGTIENLLAGVDAADKFREAGSNIGFIWATGIEGLARLKDATILTFDLMKLKILEATKASREFFHLDTAEVQNNISGLQAIINREETLLELRKNFKGADFNQSILKSVVDTSEKGKAARKASPKTDPGADPSRALDLLKSKAGDADSAIKKLGDTGRDAARGIDIGFNGSSKVIDSFRQSALSSVSQIGSALGNLIGGGGGGVRGALGGIAGSLLSSGLSSVISGSFLGGAGFDIFKGINWNANGSVISGRSVFPSAQGMQGAGEAGEEAIMPLTRVNGKLGVRASDGGGGVVQNITINAGVSQTVRAEMARLLPQIKQEAYRAVTEGQSRGQTP